MLDIKYTYSVTSTNDLASECNTPWTIFIADEQTKSRGQRGNTWESEPKKNLTFSLVLNFDFLSASKQFYISKIVSLAIVYTLKDINIESKIKWPNDIYVNDKKICGILIENTISSNGALDKSIIGIGLNVNQRIFHSDAPNPISIINITKKEQNRNDVLNCFAQHLIKLYNFLLTEDYNVVDKEYIEYLYRYKQLHEYKIPDGNSFNGKILDVLPQGDLIIIDESGVQSRYLFKEIEYII